MVMKDVFDWISVFIFSENIFTNESKTKNNKILISVEINNLIVSKISKSNMF